MAQYSEQQMVEQIGYLKIVTTANLFGVHFTNVNNGWAVGDSGIILHTINGGISFIGEDNNKTIPEGFELSQNYPNPFNPSTTINFTLPAKERVTLNIYNQLGEQVAVLLNEEKEAGQHSVIWNASNQVSGVYFYELKTQ